MQKLEAIVHPLVVEHRNRFMAGIVTTSDQRLVLFDIPLLFETQAENQVRPMAALFNFFTVAVREHTRMSLKVDSIAVVSAPEDVQKARVLARPGMTEGMHFARVMGHAFAA